MNESNLSTYQTKIYLDSLTSEKLLFRKNGKYETTEIGHDFLLLYKHIEEILTEPTVSIHGQISATP